MAGITIQEIGVRFREGVEPRPQFDVRLLPEGMRVFTGPSDAFFRELDDNVYYDLIFLDGLHTATQTYRDLLNALNHLSPGGAILVDDVWPKDWIAAIPNQDISRLIRGNISTENNTWQGDVYRVVLAVKESHPELNMMVIGDRTDFVDAQALICRDPKFERREYDPDSGTINLNKPLASSTYEEIFGPGGAGFVERFTEAHAMSLLASNMLPNY